MLLDIREKMQSWVVWLIVILICITFALFGITSYFSNDSKVVVATVGSEEISLTQFKRNMRVEVSRLKSVLGKDFKTELIESDFVKKSVLDRMIEEKVVNKYLEDAGFGVPDNLLVSTISNDSRFMQNGKFSRFVYKAAVNGAGYSTEEYEDLIRTSLKRKQFVESFIGMPFSNTNNIEHLIKLESQTRDARVLKIPANKITLDKEISEETLQQIYNNTKNNYAIPEAVKIAYAELSVKELKKDIKLSDETVKSLYEKNKEFLKTKESRNVSHIMWMAKTAEDYAKALKSANDIKVQLDKGADFAKLATKHSEDVSSASNGGSLGLKMVGEYIDKTFESVALKLESGEYSEPVKSKYGYHIIKINSIQKPKNASFEESKESLIATETARLAVEQFSTDYDNFSNLAYDNPNSLDPINDELGLSIVTTDWLTKQGGQGVLSNNKVIAEMFNDEVINEGQNSKVIEINNEHVLVLRVLEHRKKSYKKMADVIESLKIQARKNETKQKLTALGEEILAKVKTLTSIDNAEDSLLGLSFSKSQTYPGKEQLNPELHSELFKMVKTTSDSYAFSGKFVAGNYYILALSKINIPDKISADKVNAAKASNDKVLSGMFYSQFIKNLKNKMNIVKDYSLILSDEDSIF